MTLNKQKILSELGSVVNQLQSADCGCMGKLFGNSNQYSNSMAAPFGQQGGYRHGCCHGYGCGYNGVPSGEPYPQQGTYSCLGRCNPPKLYADTYNFLNENLMQPVVKEVYHDLKTISPANTIMNNEIGTKMGLNQPQQGLNYQNPMPSMNQNYSSNNMSSFNATNQMQNPQTMQNAQMMQSPQMPGTMQNQQHFGGMGPQIMNMIHGESVVNPSHPQHGRQLTEPMLIDAPQSPHGKIGVTPITAPMNANYNNYSSNPSQFYGKNINPSQQQAYATNITSSLPNMQQAIPMQQSQMPQQKPDYGQHNPGIKKFNEMFPGVMQGLGGDLGFDPMAIAIQMNPANQQQAAMNTMQKMMNNNENLGKLLQPSASPATQPKQNAIMPQNLLASNPAGHGTPTNQVQNNAIMDQSQFNNQQNIAPSNLSSNPPITSYQQQPNAVPVQNQQIYQTSSINQMNQQQAIPPQSQILDPNTGAPTTAPNLTSVPENSVMSQPISQPQARMSQQQLHTPQSIKEPIFPVDTTNNKVYHHNVNFKNDREPYYNTLGQPIEKFPANTYHNPIPSLPQTLSPQPIQSNQGKYSNVKATVSKTCLMGDKPVGKTPSRSQLQQIYNQYKGSQSFTQQNVKAPVEGTSHSDRRLNITNEPKQQSDIPVEKTGGDSYANSQPYEQKIEVDHGQIGDVIRENKPDLAKPEKDLPSNNRKYRNGLQDMVYTSYPTSAAWTFHGDGQRSNLSGRRRNRHYY